jgi:hypothetical protein
MHAPKTGSMGPLPRPSERGGLRGDIALTSSTKSMRHPSRRSKSTVFSWRAVSRLHLRWPRSVRDSPIQHPCSPKASRRLDRARACTRSTRPVDALRNRDCPGRVRDRARDAERRLASPARSPLLLPHHKPLRPALRRRSRCAAGVSPALPTLRDVFLTTLAKAALPPRVVAALDEPSQAQPLVPSSLCHPGPWLSSGPVPWSPSGSVRSSSSGPVPSSPRPALWPGRLVALWPGLLVVLWPRPLVTQFHPLAPSRRALAPSPRPVARKQTARVMEDHLHTHRPRFPLVIRRTRSICRACAFCPDPAVLKSVCRTWEDTLWATISVLCEERQSEALARLSGGFWEPYGRELDEEMGGEVGDEDDPWRADVEQELQALAMVQMQEGLGADDPFHISQLHIILLDRTDTLLDDFVSRLRDGTYDSG